MIVSAWTVSLLVAVVGAAGTTPAPVSVKTAHKHLVPRCLDGTAVADGARNWRLAPGAHSLAFTMRNEPRRGTQPHQAAPATEPGVAAISFTAEAGHAYEVEVRAPALAYSSRVWERGDWRPVVRDRTADRIVSDDPKWIETGCAP